MPKFNWPGMPCNATYPPHQTEDSEMGELWLRTKLLQNQSTSCRLKSVDCTVNVLLVNTSEILPYLLTWMGTGDEQSILTCHRVKVNVTSENIWICTSWISRWNHQNCPGLSVATCNSIWHSLQQRSVPDPAFITIKYGVSRRQNEIYKSKKSAMLINHRSYKVPASFHNNYWIKVDDAPRVNL